MPNPRTMNLLIGQAVDLRDVDEGSVQTWADWRSGITYEVYQVQRDRLNERVTSDFHAAFVKQGAWNTIGRMTSREADVVVQDYTQDGRVDQRTIEGLKKAHKMGPQSLIIPEITYLGVERAIEGNFESRVNFELIQATIKINVFMIDLETGITRQVAEVEGSDRGFLASGYWSLFLKNSGLTYVQQLTNRASQAAARKAAKLLATIDNGPVRWRDTDPLEKIRGEVLNGTAFKAVGGDNPVGDLVDVGERTWTLKFSDIRGIKNRDEFEIFTATKLGMPDAPTGVFVSVDFIDKEKELVGAHVSRTEKVKEAAQPSRPTATVEGPQGPGPGVPVAPPAKLSLAEQFIQAPPGELLTLSQGEEPEGFNGFYARVAEFAPAQGEKKTTWLERGKVVSIAPPDKKGQPLKGLVGDMNEESGEWVVWVFGDGNIAKQFSDLVAGKGWRIYPYDPTQKSGR